MTILSLYSKVDLLKYTIMIKKTQNLSNLWFKSNNQERGTKRQTEIQMQTVPAFISQPKEIRY